jgi:hypothetical protein
MRIALVCLWFAIGGIVAAQQANDSNAGLPPNYADTYLIAEETLSPDGAMAVIYPRRAAAEASNYENLKNYLVALKPFRMLAKIETQMPYFEGRNHSAGFLAQWSPDSSVALVINTRRWGPNDILLYEFAAGKVARTTDLLAKMHNALVGDFQRAKVPPYNDSTDFIFSDDDVAPNAGSPGQCTLDGAQRVRIHAAATTDPKSIPGTKAWDAALEGVWDIAAGKFTDLKVTRKFAGKRTE